MTDFVNWYKWSHSWGKYCFPTCWTNTSGATWLDQMNYSDLESSSLWFRTFSFCTKQARRTVNTFSKTETCRLSWCCSRSLFVTPHLSPVFTEQMKHLTSWHWWKSSNTVLFLVGYFQENVCPTSFLDGQPWLWQAGRFRQDCPFCLAQMLKMRLQLLRNMKWFLKKQDFQSTTKLFVKRVTYACFL